MSSLGTGFRSIVRNYKRGQAVVVGINPSRQYTIPFLHEPPALSVTNEYLTHSSPYNTMPALNLIDDEVVRPDRSPYEYVLEHPQVRVRDWAMVEKKLEQMVSGGREKLMVISDFDMTLSRSVDDAGESCWTTHGVFDNCANEVDPTLGGKFAALKAKYHPIEFCPNLTMAEKIPHMEAWWNGSHGYIIQAGFERSRIRSFVEKSKILLRSGTEQCILKLETAAVPLVVFSAGLGNIIEMFFEHKFGRTLQNTHIISNMMQFDDEERVVGFSEPLIHTFCKNSSVIRKDATFFHEVSQRKNVILLGDSMGDIHMDVGVEKNGPTLRIGFLNANVTNLLDQYMDAYDIVIIQDQTMTLPAKIIDHILHNKTA